MPWRFPPKMTDVLWSGCPRRTPPSRACAPPGPFCPCGSRSVTTARSATGKMLPGTAPTGSPRSMRGRNTCLRKILFIRITTLPLKKSTGWSAETSTSSIPTCSTAGSTRSPRSPEKKSQKPKKRLKRMQRTPESRRMSARISCGRRPARPWASSLTADRRPCRIPVSARPSPWRRTES